MKKILALGIFILLMLVGVLFASPYYTLYQIKKNYEAQDYEAVSSHINFVKVQDNLSKDLHTKYTAFIQSPKGAALATFLGQDTINHFANNLIDNSTKDVINKDNFISIAKGNVNTDTMIFAVGVLVLHDKLNSEQLMADALLLGQEKALQNQVSTISDTTDNHQDNTQYGYCGIHCFYIKTEITKQSFHLPITLYLERKNLIDWQITQIKLD